MKKKEEKKLGWTDNIGKENRKEAIKIAEKIRNDDIWDLDLCTRLCKLAGIEDKFDRADSQSFESVIFEAADILGVKIL